MTLARQGGGEAPHLSPCGRATNCEQWRDLRPPFKEHPRYRKPPQRGRQRLCNATIHAWRLHVERTLPGEETCTRLLLRWGRLPQRHSGMQVMASTWMPRRAGCDGSNVPPVTAHPPRRLQDADI